MSANLQICQTDKGLSIRVTEARSIKRILVSVLSGGLVIYFLLHGSPTSRISSVLLAGLCAFVAVKDIISAATSTDIKLLVTNLDLISAGHAPGAYAPCSISRADIYNLEFRDASGGGDSTDSPRGLYVEHHTGMSWNSSSCVLPCISEPQTEEVINAIYSRFPDTGTMAPTGSSEQHFISLNLNTPNQG
jgi:hypothetical protein